MVKVVSVVSPDLRGANMGGDIREEEGVSCRGLGDSVLTKGKHSR